MTARQVLVGGAIAMATGAVLGVLFAPDKGSTTRRKLVSRGNRYVGAARKTANEYVDLVEETLESAKETTSGLVDKVKDAVDVLSGPDHQKSSRRA
jgi:gas vesicle protein